LDLRGRRYKEVGENCVIRNYNNYSSKQKAKQSRYTSWRRFEGEKI
jgi:hypothetical protein